MEQVDEGSGLIAQPLIFSLIVAVNVRVTLAVMLFGIAGKDWNVIRRALVASFVLGVGCSPTPRGSDVDGANAGIDSLNVRLVQSYRNRDPRTYAALYTDTGVFEWPAFNTVRGRAGLEEMVRNNWASLNDVDLQLTVASRRVDSDHATEFGAFQQSWRDAKGVRVTEYGRYATSLTRQPDSSWRIDRFLGFEDSTRPTPRTNSANKDE